MTARYDDRLIVGHGCGRVPSGTVHVMIA